MVVSLGRTYGVFLQEKGSFNSGFDFEFGDHNQLADKVLISSSFAVWPFSREFTLA